MRASRATRRTVASSTDMRDSSAAAYSVAASGVNKSGRDLDRLADPRHMDRQVSHFGAEFVGVGLDDREGAVVAREDRLEIEETLAGERGRVRAHGEAVADRHDADLGSVNLVHEAHVR